MKLNSKKNFGNEKLIRKEVGRISTSFFFFQNPVYCSSFDRDERDQREEATSKED